MTVQKLRPLLQRLVKLKCHEFTVSYKSPSNDLVEVPMDNDLRELSFYSIVEGDTIIVRPN